MKDNKLNDCIIDLDDPWVLGVDIIEDEEDLFDYDACEGVVLDEVFH